MYYPRKDRLSVRTRHVVNVRCYYGWATIKIGERGIRLA